MEEPKNTIQLIIEQLQDKLSKVEPVSENDDIKLAWLLNGLTILSKDLIEFIATKSYDNESVNLFRSVYLNVFNKDRYYWEKFSNEQYKSMEEIKLPQGFAKRADEDNFDLSLLFNSTAKKDWAVYRGWHLLLQYSHQLRNTIENGGLENLKENNKSLHERVKVILEGFENRDDAFKKSFWKPFLLFLAYANALTCFEPLSDT